MSSQTGKWREEQVLVICPGSRTTMAQLGCTELTPPAHRFPTRMFKDEDSDELRPYHTFKRKKASAANVNAMVGDSKADEEDDWEYVEDPDSTEGAIYPLEGGRIVNMDAFVSFLEHVHSMLTTTYHNTPIMLMASPQWTRPDCEAIAQYIFERTRTPALCLIHSAIATQYGLKWPHMTVVDIGFEKVDVTCIYDSRVVSHKDVGLLDKDSVRREISGGEVFTQRLMKLLKDKEFTHEMAEQLKMSSICEVLPYVAELPQLMELPREGAPVGATGPTPTAIIQAATSTDGPRVAEPVAADVDMNGEDEKGVDNDGVLDVASIVTSGQTKEFLAKKEKEKADKVKTGKRGKAQEAETAAAKPVRLPNAKRTWNTFHFEEFTEEDKTRPEGSGAKAQEAKPAEESVSADAVDPQAPAEAPATNGEQANSEAAKPTAESIFSSGNETPAATQAPAPAEPERQIKRVRRDIEIGLERFTFADRAEIDRIVTTIYRTVQSIEDMYMRPPCWDNLVFVGNGCRVRGLRENIIQTLNARHLISPSSATMFTSELPSNLATPSGTGSQTPTGNFTGMPHQLPTSSSVNPLLQAATTASLALPPSSIGGTAPGSNAGDATSGTPGHHFHSQTPTSIKLAPLPSYLNEWTKNGFEEAMFLGSLVAARLAFCIHNLDAQGAESQRLMSLSRVDFK
jgi:actin-related protein 9